VTAAGAEVLRRTVGAGPNISRLRLTRLKISDVCVAGLPQPVYRTPDRARVRGKPGPRPLMTQARPRFRTVSLPQQEPVSGVDKPKNSPRSLLARRGQEPRGVELWRVVTQPASTRSSSQGRVNSRPVQVGPPGWPTSE
jgi:hypothetical protein